jgi:Ca2+-binding RTX toxin-like protein
MAVYTGTEANDTLRGSEGADYIDARGANDTLLGGWGEDSLDGGYGPTR